MEGKGTRLARRANGVFYIVTTGNSRGRSTGTTDRKAAERLLAAAINEVENPSGTPLTVADALHHYWTEHAKNVVSAELVEIALDYLRAFMGHKLIVDLCPADFEAYGKARRNGELRRSENSPERKAGNASIRRELGILRTAFLHETREKDPQTRRARLSLGDIPTIKKPASPPARCRWLTVDEEQKILDALPKNDKDGRLSRLWRFVMLAMETGSRKTALEELTWFQVDFTTGNLELNPPGRKQTRKRRPTVRMSDELRDMLKQAFSEKQSEYVLDHPGEIRYLFEPAMKRIGLPDVTPHVFRHTFATRAIANGHSTQAVADYLGDTEATIRANYYHHDPGFQEKIANWRKTEGKSRKPTEQGASHG